MINQHYFDHDLAKLSYYVFGSGPEIMLCFHGYGMHGKQFQILEEKLGNKFTFYGFDLFFHKDTKLKNNSFENIQKGLTKTEWANFIIDFCAHRNIDSFSVIGYSMGTHYATSLVEMIPHRITNYVLVAPSALKPGKLVEFFSKNKIGNKFLEKLVLSEKALIRLLKFCKGLNFIDDVGHQIMLKEINTPDLRFSLYACFTYLRFLETDKIKLQKILMTNPIKSIFIFGQKDKMYPPTIGTKFCSLIAKSHTIVLDENHEMINQPFVNELAKLLI